MNVLSVENLAKSYGSKVLFKNISFGLDLGQKAALVARNGAGKSTLLRILQGKDIADEGEVAFRNDVRVSFLEQEPSLPEGSTVYEALFMSDRPIMKVIREFEDAQEDYQNGPNPANQARLEKAMLEMDEAEAWDYESRIRQILQRLNIHRFEQPVNTLSGGQKKRVALARVLIEEPQLLIMDEPTNHLDLNMIEWLESYFDRQDMSLLLVTHDRHFLDNVCTDIFELDAYGLYRYKGNYEYFLEKKAEREFNEGREVEKARNLFKKELEWVRRQPKARGTKSKSRLEAFDELKTKIQGKKKQEEIELNFKMNRVGGKILELKKVTKAYGDLLVIDHFEHTFKKGERIGIVGKNGVGKSTFLNLITGREVPDSGKVNPGETIVFGYYSQEGLTLPEDRRVIDIVRDCGDSIPMADGSKLNAVQLLQLFQFPPDVQHGFVSKLSGGERKRLFLLTVLMKNPNFLILDEPTNDLDLMTLGILEEYLMNFQGCLLIVSHDRYFMDRLVDQLFIFEGNGLITGFLGNYGEYRIWEKESRLLSDEKDKLPPAEKESRVENNTTTAETPIPNTKQKLSFKEKQELEKLDMDIPELEGRKAALENDLNQYASDHEKIIRISRELEQVNLELDEKGLRWLELSERA